MEESKLDPKKCLPEKLIIKSAGTHFYRIGLTYYKNGSILRDRFHDPVFILIINSILLLRFIISMLFSDGNEDIHVFIGDFSLYCGGLHLNITVTSLSVFAILSQLLNYYNFRNDIKPTFLDPFRVISGNMTPECIGITTVKDIIKFRRNTRI